MLWLVREHNVTCQSSHMLDVCHGMVGSAPNATQTSVNFMMTVSCMSCQILHVAK